MHRPPLHAVDVANVLYKRDLDVCVLTPFLCQDLDAHISILVRRSSIIAIYLLVEDHRRRAWRLRHGRHFQFFRRDRLPFVGASNPHAPKARRRHKQSRHAHPRPPALIHWFSPGILESALAAPTPAPGTRKQARPELGLDTLLLPGYLTLGEITALLILLSRERRYSLSLVVTLPSIRGSKPPRRRNRFPRLPPCGIIPAHLFSNLACHFSCERRFL